MEAFLRYERPFLVTETGHSREHRPEWLRYIAKECEAVIREGASFWGVCLYPIIDRPDWDHLSPWHGSGMWDAELQLDGPPLRVLYEPMAEALKNAQILIDTAINTPKILSEDLAG